MTDNLKKIQSAIEFLAENRDLFGCRLYPPNATIEDLLVHEEPKSPLVIDKLTTLEEFLRSVVRPPDLIVKMRVQKACEFAKKALANLQAEGGEKGYMNCRELAEKFGIPYHALRKRLDRWEKSNIFFDMRQKTVKEDKMKIGVTVFARLAGVHINTVYLWLRLKKIPASKNAHGVWEIDLKDAKLFLKERRRRLGIAEAGNERKEDEKKKNEDFGA